MLTPKGNVRLDRFEIGDRVEFIDEDPYVGFGMEERHRSQFGKGPYRIEDVEDATNGAPWMLDRGFIKHPQIVYVNGVRYSAGWFKPVRAEEPRGYWGPEYVDHFAESK